MLLIAVASIALVFAGTIDPNKSDDDHVAYGAKFSPVAKLSCVEHKTGHARVASCVIISPRCVITAAHVVRDADGWKVTLDDGSTREIKGFAFPDEDKTDLAFGHIDGDFSLDFYPPLYGGRDEPGRVASIAGYGMAGTFATGAAKSDGRRRAGSNVIDRAERGLLICSIDGNRRTELEFLISFGDSGGGLFLGNELAGVNSFIMAEKGKGAPKSRYGEESAHVRISDHKAWIEGEIKRVSAL